MDVKYVFLNGYINKEVYVSQTLGFKDHENADYVFKLKRALYVLKQALIKQWFNRDKVDTTLFIRCKDKHILLIQNHVDDIIFGSTDESLCKKFSSFMEGEFEMSLMGELTYFLGLPIKKPKGGTFISQKKYCMKLLKKFNMKNSKTISTHIASNMPIDKDESKVQIYITKY